MSATFLSLPTTLFINIWDFCGPDEIMAIGSTCRMFTALVESSMLQVHAKRVHLYKDEKIPMFFADQCHTVFVKCKMVSKKRHQQDHRVVVLSRKRRQNADFDTIVWEDTKQSNAYCQLTFDISFRNDPSQEYILRHECDDPLCDYTLTVQKQFMSRSLTATMKGALTVCLEMGFRKSFAWHSAKGYCLEQLDATRFYMRLFVLGYRYLSDESSPVCRFFESGPTSTVPYDLQLAQNQILNLLEQALEQKEPLDCVKLLQPTDNVEQTHSEVYCDILPDIILNKKFVWNRCLDQDDDDFLSNEELVFIARVPLVPMTTRVSLWGQIKADYPDQQFVLFLQKRQSGLDNLDSPIDAYVTPRYSSDLPAADVKPEHEACFLYMVPGNVTTVELEKVEVTLEISLDRHIRGFHQWMWPLLEGFGGLTTSIEQRYLPIALMRAGALALLGPNHHEQKRELKDAFEMEGLDLTPMGLECMIDVCNVLLQD